MNPRLSTAVRAARAAGHMLRDKHDAPLEIRAKGKRDIVTDADYAAERIIREILLSRFPEDRFLSEEGDAAAHQALWALAESAEPPAIWVVDPVDGTTNYAHRIPAFSVSIGLVRGARVDVGVVYDPLRDELFAAERGEDATLNGRRIAVSRTRRFESAVVGTEWARTEPARGRAMALLARMVARATTARCLGSAALSLCYVAAGRIDAYYHLSLFPWDVAAAGLVVEQAGGRVTTPTGAPWSVHSGAYVASNGLLHRAMLRFFKRS